MRAGGEIVYVAVGANLGDREATFSAVVRSLSREPDLLLLGASPVYETPPVGPPGQSPYLNGVLELRVWISPLELLSRLQAIESALGRERGPDTIRWGPRVIDLDLIFFGERCIDLPELVVPHPRAHERAFVMTPLAALAPRLRHPVLGRPVGEIAEERSRSEEVSARPRPEGWPGGDATS